MRSTEKHFSIDARAILTLGRDSIKDHTTALLELVKNSYDADATRVEIEIFSRSPKKFIRIADNGCGMTENEVEKYWLRIGYSEKRSNRFSRLKRRKTGEKGIGRISADRLGAILELKTKAKNKKTFGLQVNWNDFNVEGKDLTTIPLDIISKPQIEIPTFGREKISSGTELIIKKMRQTWIKNDIENFYDELTILVPPFKQVQDFEIYLKTDVAKEYNKKVESPFYENAEIELNAEFDGKEIFYYLKDIYNQKEAQLDKKETIKWKNLVQRTLDYSVTEISEIPRFGPVKVTLLFYPRVSKILEGTPLRLSDLREFLDKNAGIKIYRDNIRVKPYGNPKDPEGDWLGLAERKTREPAGIMRPTWKVAANQIVGAVFVSRDSNPLLVDSSAREGLILGEEFYELRAFVIGLITILETHRHKSLSEIEKEGEKKVSPTDEVKDLKAELNILKHNLISVKSDLITVSQRPINRTLDQMYMVTEKIKETQKSIEELVSKTRVFRGLATIGIAAAVFGHETQSSIEEFIAANYAASSILSKTPKRIDLAIKEISKAKKYANQVSSWGAFALARVQRDKRRKRRLNIKQVIEETIKDVESIFLAASIDIEKELQLVTGRTFAMDVEALLLNLLTNSYFACQQIRRKRRIKIVLKKEKVNGVDGFSLIVSDSGPGVADKFKDRIWDPLFTTRVDREGKQIGTGLGLTIVQSIVEDLNGAKAVDFDPKLKGARFKIWLPLN